MTMRSKLKDTAIIAMAAYLLMVIFSKVQPYSLGWNTTPSIPLGLYIQKEVKDPFQVQLGDVVCFRYQPPQWAADRDYAAPGRKLCKPVVALPGHKLYLEVDESGNRAWIAQQQTYPVRKMDSKGRPMPQGHLTEEVPVEHWVVLSNHSELSLDSRYLGPVPFKAGTHTIKPLWVWSPR